MLDLLNDFIWSKLLIVMLIGLGLYFTVASRFVQFRYFSSMFRIFGEAFKRQPGQLSSFQALMLSVAGRVGAGNIAGVSVAIMLGGPGAIFWMWVVALVGMATSYFECSLAQLYKRREPDGTYRGGPAFYIQHGLGQRWLGIVVSILLLVTFGFGFNAVQSFTVASSLHDTFGLPTIVSGLILTGVIGVIIFGGIKRIASMADVLVPIMAFSYIGMALVVIGMNLSEVPATFAMIFKAAFGLEPAFAGGIGAAIMMGVKRGLFSNEAGLGSAPNVAAVAEVKHPAAQGIVQALSVFIDTLLVCTSTALIILLSGVYQPGSEMAGVVLTQTALAAEVGEWGRVFVSIALLLFVFTTLIYNYYLGENALGFFSQKRGPVVIYRVLVVALVLWGSVQDLGTVFAFADVTMGLLAICNLIALALLFKVGLRLMRDYDAQIKAGVESPVFDPQKFADLDLDPKAWQAPADAPVTHAELGDRVYQR
ncbi:alanine/glycine:cation symporter family protein [Pseudomonas mendocina]|uniref:alanine/glycine:cation symporter family protein n=1 Tax=Pseudomonas wenzhouensis TaxID=2906062 RepID=UPI0011C9ABAC|nr:MULTISPECIES: alanine/glycine:cation symporter family protein [Pseudomonas]MDM9652094.1 alanine/glycine:cation symporter family protein [Pseudomonas wenzhouensis]MDV5863451.1 alanine/glycine:cation symporter family protein [Pseudomonas mendocina]TXR40309.1 alanine:cation symporter family protein [Pseudomonas mendocina]UFQ97817.1 alanine:cation symporter family protein [Pseudomonas wenzhouensis]